jgi:DNA repair exonuclease SbcCD ATPase subunit
MTPLALRFKNFRSFKAEQIFHFPTQPGLYFMQGLNEVEPRLGGNGVGKTSIWEALTWCLYGMTSDGLKAGDICNWDVAKGAEVWFIFMLPNGEPQAIRRTWGPNSWTLHACSDDLESLDEKVSDLTKDATNPVLSLLRLELDPWLQCVLMAQGQAMFLDLKQDAQASLFSSVMGLERWIEYSQKASKKASAQDAVSRELERRLAALAGELEGVEGLDFKKGEAEWKREQDQKIYDLDQEHFAGMQKRKKLKADLQAAESYLEEARERHKAAVRGNVRGHDLEVMEREARSYQDVATITEREIAKEGVALDAIESHLRQLKENVACPTCGHALTPAHRDQELRKALKAREQTETLIEMMEANLKRQQEKEATCRDQIKAFREGVDRARVQVEEAERALSNARRAYELHERELDRIEDRSEELTRETNPFAKLAQDARRRAQELRDEARLCQGRLDASNERYGLFSYWVRGFKEIRLRQIAEALTELEVAVNSAGTELGLIDWELKFAVDREGKGGGIQRGFSVFVKSPHNPQPTPWKAWSGGEKQRLRLAAAMGLADLIRSRTGAAMPLEVWDEPTNGLSPEGWADLLESLAARAQREERLIFITDHKAHDFGGFAGNATVIKRPSGSKIVTSWSKA